MFRLQFRSKSVWNFKTHNWFVLKFDSFVGFLWVDAVNTLAQSHLRNTSILLFPVLGTFINE